MGPLVDDTAKDIAPAGDAIPGSFRFEARMVLVTQGTV